MPSAISLLNSRGKCSYLHNVGFFVSLIDWVYFCFLFLCCIHVLCAFIIILFPLQHNQLPHSGQIKLLIFSLQSFCFGFCCFCVSGGSFAEQTDDSESRELDHQPSQHLSVLHWGKTLTLSLHAVTLSFVLHLSTQNSSLSLFVSWFRQWWLFSIVSGWMFVVLRSQQIPQVSHFSDLNMRLETFSMSLNLFSTPNKLPSLITWSLST